MARSTRTVDPSWDRAKASGLVFRDPSEAHRPKTYNTKIYKLASFLGVQNETNLKPKPLTLNSRP